MTSPSSYSVRGFQNLRLRRGLGIAGAADCGSSSSGQYRSCPCAPMATGGQRCMQPLPCSPGGRRARDGIGRRFSEPHLRAQCREKGQRLRLLRFDDFVLTRPEWRKRFLPVTTEQEPLILRAVTLNFLRSRAGYECFAQEAPRLAVS